MAVLTVFDDGDDSGELVRIRESIFVIGRTDGNLTIPHDSSISGRHLEISRRGEGRAARWFLRDLSSTNGTFVRAAHLTLQQDQEVLIGRTRLRFDAPRGNVDPEPGSADDATANATRRWQAPSRVDLETAVFPSLVELTAEGEGRRHAIRDLETWIGRDPGLCSVVLSEPTVDPRHGRLYRDARNRWILENARSSNGIWARIDDICLDSGGQFQCGEQRFAIKVL